MRCSSCLLAVMAAAASAQETVLGVYIFSRHGDRTAKMTPPANLTDLGYQQVYTSGTYFRNRYVASGASRKVLGLNTDVVRQSQLTASAPADTVLQNSAVGFLQGLYPPVGQTLGTSTLRNGTAVEAPLGGYQLIPLQQATTGTNSENMAWLQGTTGCANAQLSSNDYFASTEFMTTLNQSQALYNNIAPMVNRTFTAAQTTFKNAYTIWDLLNVASIHNTTNFQSPELLTPEAFAELQVLANEHEFGLAYNSSEPVRAITGAVIANEIVQALNGTITSQGKSKLNIQFGAYAGMLSFFGLANLTAVNPDFYGVPDYASSLTWELVTNATVNATSFPTADQIAVRFYFHNGTFMSNSSEIIEYPLFNSGRSPLPWMDFVTSMNKFSVKSQREWCTVCGNSTGTCSSEYLDNTGATSGNTSSTSSSSSGSGSGSGGMSLAVAGVIGAMVTLAVIMGLELLIVLLGGFRLVSKKRLANAGAVGGSPASSEIGKA